MALQGTPDFNAILSVDDIENVLAVGKQTASSSDKQGHSGPELPLPLETSQSRTTPSRPMLMEIFPYQNTSSPADPDADLLPYPTRGSGRAAETLQNLPINSLC